MFKLFFKVCLSFFTPCLFLISPSCSSEGQTAAITQVKKENRLPTRWELRREIRRQSGITLVYPDGNENTKFYQPRIDATSKNQRFGIQIKTLAASELSKEHLEKEIIFLVGRFHKLNLFKDLQAALPFEINDSLFIFNDKVYQSSTDIFKLFTYPNPYNSSLPIFILTGIDNQQIRQFLQDNYPLDLSRMFWSSWGYEIHQKRELKVSGYFNDITWQLEPSTHFDFSGPNDTLLQTDHFRFIAHQSPLSKIEVENIAKQCEITYQELTAFINAPKDLPIIDYHFYASIENKGLQKSSMEEASTNFEDNSIAVVFNENFKGSYIHPENQLILRNVYDKPYLKALEDGLAIRFTKKWHRKGYKYWTQKLFKSGNLPPLKELLNNELYEKESYIVMGAMAASFVDFVIQYLGKEEFVDNYHTYEVEDFNHLEPEWQVYLSDNIDKIGNSTSLKKDLTYLKGFNFAHEGYRVFNGYGSKLAKESLEKLANIGTNAVAIVPYSFMRNTKKPAFIPIHHHHSSGGENDESVVFAHREAQKLGMHTMLKPQVWFRGSWPGDLEMKNETDWAMFFDSYYRWVRHYALLAEINEFDSYCIGVEFAKATLAKEKEWRKIIRKIRGIYSGPLTYAANWGEEFENLKFWDELDFIGLNCYYPLSKNDNPTKRELNRAFRKTLEKVENIAKKENKPVVFTEIGFRSVEGPWKNPHAEPNGRSFNDTHQKLCYEVVFENIKDKKWCKGILWWKWPSYITYRGQNNVGFSPNLKQTERVIEENFKTKK